MKLAANNPPIPDSWGAAGHPLRVLLVGAGGNGSEFFDALVRLHFGLKALAHPGLHVTVYDDDEVSPSNVIRQRFWSHEVGMRKAVVVVARANMLMGTQWVAVPNRFMPRSVADLRNYDLIITAVDNISARQAIGRLGMDSDASLWLPLWLDMGCDKHQGQVVLGALEGHSLSSPLPNVIAHYPEILTAVDQPQTPSCSDAESIARQDLMINSAVAQAAGNLLWQSLRQGYFPFNGVIVDLKEGGHWPIRWPSAAA